MTSLKDFKKKPSILTSVICLLFLGLWSMAAQDGNSSKAPTIKEIENKVITLMEEAKIPGLSLVIVREGEPTYVKGFGFADQEKKTPVDEDTLFELASTSKAFTALAALKCEADGKLSLDDRVSKYLPWFYVQYKGEKQDLTIRQCLHQTTGIPVRTVSDIPIDKSDEALENTLRKIVGIELDGKPGSKFQYATINYDIVGAVVAKASGLSFEKYMKEEILTPLGMVHTRVGNMDIQPGDQSRLATGYKISFFKPRAYSAPVYRGNTPAGYMISNARDMGLWLRFHLGLDSNTLTPLAKKSHLRDKSVPPTGLTSYAMGWMENLDGSGQIMHSGANPNYTAHVVFNPEQKIGVAILANSNSTHTPYVGQSIMGLLQGRAVAPNTNPPGGIDKSTSLIALFLVAYLLFALGFLLLVFFDVIKGRRVFQKLNLKIIGKLIYPLFLMIPFLFAIYLLPKAMAGFSWGPALVWSPGSFQATIILLLVCMAGSYIGYFFSVLFPQQNKYLRSVPSLILLSLSSGVANAVVIFLITISLFSKSKMIYILYYFILAGVVYVIGRKILQARLIKITHSIIYDLRVKLVEKIFFTSYQKFEKLETGRILATLSNDTGQIGGSANLFVTIISSLVTVVGAFIYLGTIAFWATVVTLAMVFVIATLYFMVSQKANVYFNEARNTQNTYMSLLNGLQDGYKELSLHYKKKIDFKNDMEGVCAQFRDKLVVAMIKFVNAFMVGESLLIVILGCVGFAVPLLFPDIQNLTLMGFIMVLLYLIGPVNSILNSIPGIMQIRVAWDRVRNFMKDIPANMSPAEMAAIPESIDSVKKIEAKGVFFEYEAEDESEKFSVGPMDFEISKGEIVFIVGGNGSGKTTLAKLLTGLYIPSEGSITVDGKEINNYHLGEFFSVIFGDYHLFEKMYNVDLTGKEKVVEEYLKLLRLEEKVSLEENQFSTLDLSSGQRKRLALLQCYLEDRPIYLFDELAADQDPEFRKFFYRELLTEMKEKGKMVIAITHDDHYFDVADRVVKMDMGKVDLVDREERLSVTK